MIASYLHYEGVIRLDADGDDIGPLVRVHFTARGYVPYVSATWEQPAEGGMFEDIGFTTIEMDQHSFGSEPLTDAEIASIQAWCKSDEAHDRVQNAALRIMREDC